MVGLFLQGIVGCSEPLVVGMTYFFSMKSLRVLVVCFDFLSERFTTRFTTEQNTVEEVILKRRMKPFCCHCRLFPFINIMYGVSKEAKN